MKRKGITVQGRLIPLTSIIGYRVDGCRCWVTLPFDKQHCIGYKLISDEINHQGIRIQISSEQFDLYSRWAELRQLPDQIRSEIARRDNSTRLIEFLQARLNRMLSEEE